MLCCHGVRGGKSVDAPVPLRLLLGRFFCCFSYLEVKNTHAGVAIIYPRRLKRANDVRGGENPTSKLW